MEKFASLKKIHTKIILTKTNLLELIDLVFLCYTKLPFPDLSGVIKAHLIVVVSTKRKLMKQYSLETFACCSRINVQPFLWHFGTPPLNRKNQVTGQMKHAAMAATDYRGEVHVETRRQ